MFVDSQDGWALRGVPFGELAFQPVAEVALDRRRSDALPLTEPVPVDSVQVLAENRLAKRFGRVLTGQNARQPLPKLPTAIQAQPLACGNLQPAVP